MASHRRFRPEPPADPEPYEPDWHPALHCLMHDHRVAVARVAGRVLLCRSCLERQPSVLLAQVGVSEVSEEQCWEADDEIDLLPDYLADWSLAEVLTGWDRST